MKKNIDENPLLVRWETRHATPPFGSIELKHYRPAVSAAIEEARANVEAIACNVEHPTFANTVEALEHAMPLLDRVSAVLFNLNECETCDEMQRIVMEVMPEITRFENKVWMDERLFARVKALHDAAHEEYSTEQRELLEKYYQLFVRKGVNLDPESKRRFSSNAEELATLTERFGQNALADTNDYILHITDDGRLRGLPDTVVHAAREEASQRNLEGWVFTLKAPSYRPFMMYADERELREQMWRAYNSRGNRGNGNDNNDVIRRIANLRLEQARLLGYKDYASYSLTRTMACDTDTVEQFLKGLREASLPYAERDLAEVASFAREHGADNELQSWDFSYWSEKLKRDRYDFDSEALRPYLQLDTVRQGIFDLYGKLYGLRFVKSDAIEVYHEDVSVYEVLDGDRFMGVLYLDMFPRGGKRSGAWMTEFRSQWREGAGEVRPLIQVVCNFSKPVSDKPSLLSFDELETFMHEMGHAIHGMLSDVSYPSVSGTNVRHDFVEMPSQVMENWCYETEFLNTFARHYLSGEPIPAEYIEKIRRSKNFQAGWLCLRQLNFGTVDMAFHTITEPLADTVCIEDFEHKAMTELLPVIDGCCTSTAFTHIFAGGYAAGYYGYKWAEALDADIFSKFKADGIFNSETARAFRDIILSRGGSRHPADLFRDFMGRDPDPDALLHRCGFDK